jgi:hypothetical protein
MEGFEGNVRCTVKFGLHIWFGTGGKSDWIRACGLVVVRMVCGCMHCPSLATLHGTIARIEYLSSNFYMYMKPFILFCYVYVIR